MFRRSVTVGLLVLSVILVSRAVSSAGKPYLGISLAAKIPPSVAAHLEIEGGAMIIAVIDGSPAAQAGLKKHDIIVKAAGMKIRSRADLQKALSNHTGNDKDDTLELVVRRGAGTLKFAVTPAEAPPKRAPLKRAPAKPAAGAKAYLGVHLEGISASLATHLKLSAGEGVLVERSLPGSPAYAAGLRKHDVILKVAGKAVTSSRKKGGPGTIILPEDLNGFQLGGIRGGITGGLRIETLRSLLGDNQDNIVSNLSELVAAHKPGDQVELAVVQEGERKKLRVMLAAAPSRTRSLFPPENLHRGGTSSSSASSVTISDGELSITVRNANGKRTFSVRRGKEIIADDEPWEAIEKLPEDIQKKVRQLKLRSSSSSESDGGKPRSPGEKKLPPGKEKKKPL